MCKLLTKDHFWALYDLQCMKHFWLFNSRQQARNYKKVLKGRSLLSKPIKVNLRQLY